MIETILQRFRQATPQISRDYFLRFTQLLLQTLELEPQLRPFVETSLRSTILPFDQTNEWTFEYQLRLLRFALEEKLSPRDETLLAEIFQHRFLRSSSLLRHLSLQIGLLVAPVELNDPAGILRLFSSDENLYVRRSFVAFASLCLPRKFYVDLRQNDLLFELVLLRPPNEQKELIDEFHLFSSLDVDSPSIRRFVLSTGRYLLDERPLISYLDKIWRRSLQDYVHCLLTLVAHRFADRRPIEELNGCLRAVLLFMQDAQIEEIDETPSDRVETPLTISLAEDFFFAQIDPNGLASLVLDALQPHLDATPNFLAQLDSYPSTIFYMLRQKIRDEKLYAQLIRCAERLPMTTDLLEFVWRQIDERRRSTCLYQAFLHLLVVKDEGKAFLLRLPPLINILLSSATDHLHWDQIDCLLTFLHELIERLEATDVNWFDSAFVDELTEKLIDHPNEFVQANLIRLLSLLVQHDFVSSRDAKLVDVLRHFAEYSLGDVGRCALAKTWNVLLEKNPSPSSLGFRCEQSIDEEKFKKILREEIRRLIGDASEETELQCLKLIETIGFDAQDEDLMRYFLHDGATKEIQRQARRIFSQPEEKLHVDHQHSAEILQEEFRSILHWFDHPDEHLVLDCD